MLFVILDVKNDCNGQTIQGSSLEWKLNSPKFVVCRIFQYFPKQNLYCVLGELFLSLIVCCLYCKLCIMHCTCKTVTEFQFVFRKIVQVECVIIFWCNEPFTLDDLDFSCRQKWVAWLPMVLFTLDDKDKIVHYYCYQWNPFLSCHLVRTGPILASTG